MPANTAHFHNPEKELSKLNIQPSLDYILTERNGPIKVNIPQKVILKWREIKTKLPRMSFMELFQCSAGHLPFQIKPGNDRLEERFRIISSLANQQLKGVRGDKRVKLLEKCRMVYVYPEELINASSIKRQVEAIQQENETTAIAELIPRRDYSRAPTCTDPLANLATLSSILFLAFPS